MPYANIICSRRQVSRNARILAGARTLWLRRIFTVVVVILAFEMLYKGLTGGL